ncbi:cysteine-rich receptor-like protein kinase, partial [Trifolium medium]|nr:cysteine-rich receptor-like protein kinase [Trifolium medium]
STTKAQNGNPTFLYQVCSTNKTTANSTYKSNLGTLFSSLSSNSTKEFYNTTVPRRTSSNTVYGLYMCRGDVSSSLCQQCVTNATQKLSTDSDCSLSKQAVIWYDECMVRYNNTSFFSTMATRPGAFLMNTANITNQESFMRLLFDTMNKTADKAANSSVGAKKYATKEASISGFQTLYSLAQCTEDLSQQDCRTCLSDAIQLLPRCCEGKQGGRVLLPSCNIRYELYPFYRNLAPSPSPSPSAAPGLAPPTTTSNLGGNVI